jgi:predicted DNA-binding transcriptional regulator
LLFPLIFVGLIPLSVGVSKLFRKKVLSEGKPASGPQQKIQSEKEILRLAKEQGGKFTVLQVASETSLSIEEARDALDSMVKKGYIQLQVMDSGILRYEIPEFFPEPEKDDIEKKIDELKDR